MTVTLPSASVCDRLAVESKTRLASVTRPVTPPPEPVIVPVPVNWLGEASNDWVVKVPPLPPKLIVPGRAPGPTYVVPVTETLPPLVMFSVP